LSFSAACEALVSFAAFAARLNSLLKNDGVQEIERETSLRVKTQC
jgi:hypothetical protein